MLCAEPNMKCHLNECDKYPGVNGMEQFFEQILEDNQMESIPYKQWVNQSGRTSLENITRSSDDFIRSYSMQLATLIPHDFIAKKQSDFLKMKMDQLRKGEFIVISDFAENYHCVIQDEVQSAHWNQQQVTLHPFAIYCKDERDELKFKSLLIIAESLKYNYEAVYQFQQELFKFLDETFQFVTKIYFFSDGAASQYKNEKNFFELCQNRKAHNFDVEWHFFTTAHGKGSCDGIGGAFKRNATRASLQKKFEGQQLQKNSTNGPFRTKTRPLSLAFVRNENTRKLKRDLNKNSTKCQLSQEHKNFTALLQSTTKKLKSQDSRLRMILQSLN